MRLLLLFYACENGPEAYFHIACLAAIREEKEI
jgi:hypothetical protein